ncbi:MAG: ATP citrate (pro-S)-lyase [Candidatus Azotimanducaceae bacterium]|jgi:ATP citrate (pro-S)-lyase
MINDIRSSAPKLLVAGNHTGIIQSILDFDYASGKESPSVIAIISAGRKAQKFFWGDGEILIPVCADLDGVKNLGLEPDFLFCITSASSTPSAVEAFFGAFPDAKGAHLFAEGVSERDALSLIEKYGSDKLIAGPSGVGLCVPGSLKLGAIGGILGARVAELGKTTGHTAVVCSSGGMVNELMYQVVASGAGISFAACYGGDRFPTTSPLQWMLEAQNDPQSKEIVFFGELGGNDEYILRDAIKDGQISKPVYAYIAGRYESKDENIQFGHAKALAKAEEETAAAKMKALSDVGVHVSEKFNDFMKAFEGLSRETSSVDAAREWTQRDQRAKLTNYSAPAYRDTVAQSFTEGILLRILNREKVSPELVSFTDMVFAQLIDHGPHVSGAVNAMVTARAGRDMSSALATGVLTVGDRFGGAINGAASILHTAVSHGTTPEDVVNDYSKRREYILGIGHKKYSVYKPDPRVAALVEHGKSVLRETSHLDFALQIEALTSKKRANLILNVDGAVSALFMDFLHEKEGFTTSQIQELIDIEFFNSLFLIPRSAGFVGNYLDQKRIDEGLFRLDDRDSYNF